jgi:hypothetical protein
LQKRIYLKRRGENRTRGDNMTGKEMVGNNIIHIYDGGGDSGV